MTPEQFARVREVFEAAIALSPNERETLLDRACADAPWLRAEAASLIAAHERATGFIEAPVHQAAAHLLVDDAADTLEGQMVGPYLIRHPIGRGGMGVVYLADDTRLSRRVALKALVPGVGRDPDRRERLRREARAAAGLSHPGIATVYALEEINGELYLACEYVPGPTLRAMLEGGPLPLTHVLDCAIQLARALAAAHAHGVVHRDLKPENVVKTATGIVKVLDFGIARVEHLAPSRLTRDGTILGTPAYMSPEQAQGQETDFRADLFSFGLLVYELASGTNPFEAETAAATFARLLQLDPPPLSDVCAAGSPRLDAIVATCLRKESRERYQSTNDLVADLEQLQTEMAAARHRATSLPIDPHPSVGTRRVTPQWWWEFHQIAVSVVYVLMIYPAWRARAWLPAPWGMVFLFGILACAAAATSLRLHLAFTARVFPSELAPQRIRVLPWTRVSDAVFAAWLLLAAFTMASDHPEIATLFVTVAIAGAVASFLIEPATTRAAFPAMAAPIPHQPSPR